MTPALTLEVVAEARRLVATHWTSGAYARNSLGLEVPPTAQSAVCFCVTGALARASGMDVLAIEEIADGMDLDFSIPRRSDISQASALAVLDELAARVSPADGAKP